MKYPAGAKSPVSRQDSKSRKIKKAGNDAATVPAKTRCTPLSSLSNLGPRASTKSCVAWITIALLGVMALLHAGSFATNGQVLMWANVYGVKVSYFLGKQMRYHLGIYNPNYTYPGLTPPFVLQSSGCFVPSASSSHSVPAAASTESSTHKNEFDICLVVYIGDDDDRPNDSALPYPLVSRLTDAMKEEAVALRENGRDGRSQVNVLVGVDYGSVVCAIVKDTVDELAGVSAECRTFSDVDDGTKCGKLVIGESKRFVQQMPEEWSDAVEWQSQRSVDLDCADPAHSSPDIPVSEWQPTVVTGFSSNHMTVGLLLLRSIGRAAKEGAEGLFNVSVVVWAMEVFQPDHQRLLDCVIDELNHEYGVRAEVRMFDWSAHPSWMRINQDLGYFGGTGEYAWKAVMVHTVLRERGSVLWADAGDRFHDTESLIGTLTQLNATGFVSRKSHGTVYTRTHPLSLKYYRANLAGIWDLQNCEAAIVGFTLKKYSELARPWYECSITRQCIAPVGSDRSNHRQDQAALTLLSILTKSPCEGAHPNFSHHMDDDPTLKDISGTYLTKCYVDPLVLVDQGTLKPVNRPHGIIN